MAPVASLPAALRAVRGWLPSGAGLPDEEFDRRHRLLTVLLLLHLPVIVGAAVGFGDGARRGLLDCVVPAVLGLGALWRGRRLRREFCTSVGLFVCSAVLVTLSHGLIEMHFHYFCMVAFVALYQDWKPFLLALGFVVGQHAIMGAVDYGSVYDHMHDHGGLADATKWALVHGGFILFAAGGQVVTWRYAQDVLERDEAARQALREHERALLRRMREAQRMQEDLVATVSHEFRTPITAIRGSAQTLLARHDRIDEAARLRLLAGVLTHSERLGALLENMLVAASVKPANSSAIADLGAAVPRAVAAVAERYPHAQVDAAVEPDLRVLVDPDALNLILVNLLDNAVKHSVRVPVVLAVTREHADVVVEVTNDGASFAPGEVERMFERFVQLDSSDTRRIGGLGMGLFVVRRLVEVHRGTVSARVDGDVATFAVRLRAVPVPRGSAQALADA